MKPALLASLFLLSGYSFSQSEQKGQPFEEIDQTEQNGSDRRDSSVFNKSEYFTPSIFVDVNYTHSFQ